VERDTLYKEIKNYKDVDLNTINADPSLN